MLTPQEVSERTFSKSAFGGYNMTMVDDFLDELTDDYTALYKENTTLKAKMKVLVDKVEEYRVTEDAMRRALLTAQNMASSMVSEAEEKKETLLADAEMEARAKIGALHDEIVAEQKRLNLLKAQTKAFADKARALCEDQLRQLRELPDMTPEQVEKTTAEVRLQQDTADDVAALSEKIVASFDGDALPDRDDTILFPIAKPRHDEPSGAEDRDATRPIKLADLKFGRSSNGEDDGK